MTGLPPDALSQWWVPLVLLALALVAGAARGWLAGRRARAVPPPPPLPPATRQRPVSGSSGAKTALSLGAVTMPSAAVAAVSSAEQSDAISAPVSAPLLHDPLTGLASRLLLEDRLAAAVMRAEARQRRFALLYIDLDGFKPVNESFGYGAGDQLLKEVGRRLQGLGRSTDGLARMAGDEFLMLLDGDPDASAAALVADRVRQALQRPYLLQGKEVRLCCSIGIVLYPDHGPKGRLIAHADAAMLAAKRAGGNVHCFYEPRMEQDAEAAIDMQRDLRDAIHSELTPLRRARLHRRIGGRRVHRQVKPVRADVVGGGGVGTRHTNPGSRPTAQTTAPHRPGVCARHRLSHHSRRVWLGLGLD